MQFIEGYLYHIYNQGNNQQKILFIKENYLFFLEKIRKHLLPYVDILAWCLVSNHFHLIVLVNRLTLSNGKSVIILNQSIAIILRSYTSAINNQEERSGALFREGTKAECINQPNGLTPSFFNSDSGTLINISHPERQYPQICFNYIHQNPVKAGLVKSAGDWEFSSAMDYTGKRNDSLVNKIVAEQYVDF